MSQSNESADLSDQISESTGGDVPTGNVVTSSETTNSTTTTTESSTTDSRSKYLKDVVDMRTELKIQRLEMVTQLRERVNLVSLI